jgi:hypothetical protein
MEGTGKPGVHQVGTRTLHTLKFANKNISLSATLTSFEAAAGGLTAFDGVAPLLLTPFWTGLPEARCVIGFIDDRDHAGGLSMAPKLAIRHRNSSTEQ